MSETEIRAKSPTLALRQSQAEACPSKFHSHVLYKVLTAIFFLVILPLVPSRAPEFINQTLLTRSWELLHLLFVGIAVSYGLFSRRNEEKENEVSGSKFDNVQSYVSGLLHVSSVFDDEPETPSANDESVSSSDESKVQTWSSRYFRNESVVVAEERPAVNEQRVRSEKPLLLPVRSLKSRVVADDDLPDESRAVSGSKPRASSRRLLSKSKRSTEGEFGGVNLEEVEDKLNENVVLRSPVPWRSRSGRMEMQEEADNPPMYSPVAAMEESESNWIDSRSSRPQTSRSTRANAIGQKLSPSPSPSPTPKKPSPPPTVSPELQGKGAEDFVRKKSFYRSPPPPPPPPPPPRVRRISSMKQSSWLNDNDVPHQKDLRRSFTSKPRSSIRDTGDDIDMMVGPNSSVVNEPPRNYVDSQSMGKSVRTVRPGELVNEPPRRGREFGGNELKGRMDHQNVHVQDFEENPIEFPDEEKEELVEKLDMETDDDMETEEEEDTMATEFTRDKNGGTYTETRKDNERSSSNEEAGSSSMAGDGGPDVDKKADEFIAKFREQIRLQRIESIKRSSGQIRRNSSRQT